HSLHDYPVSALSSSVSNWINHLLSAQLDPHIVDLALGIVPGNIGTISSLLLVLGSVYLFATRVISWHAPVSFLAVFLLTIWVFGGLPAHHGWFAGTPLVHLLSGATVLGALILCTDPVTSPLTRRGMLLFGAGIGVFALLIRLFGVAEEAIFMAILLMNIAVPAIDRLMERRTREFA
ncbi:MAG TPA: RnfABCDGE type electron transport complex subunit D, partial [Spirochaetia bacterium]|nr:RnfABCDGE type electron transport complex subunit D [Spirochaetia bacterium]